MLLRSTKERPDCDADSVRGAIDCVVEIASSGARSITLTVDARGSEPRSKRLDDASAKAGQLRSGYGSIITRILEACGSGARTGRVAFDNAVEFAWQGGCLFVGQVKVHAPQWAH